jgi:flagellar biogenesis protein FliO
MEPAKPGDYLETDFDDETISEPDDLLPCVLSIFILLIVIIIIVFILKKIQGSTSKKDYDSKDNKIE